MTGGIAYLQCVGSFHFPQSWCKSSCACWRWIPAPRGSWPCAACRGGESVSNLAVLRVSDCGAYCLCPFTLKSLTWNVKWMNIFLGIFQVNSSLKVKVLVAQSCPTLCDPRDCSPPGTSAQGIFQAIILEWVAVSFFRGSSWPRDWTHISYISCIGGRILYQWATCKAPLHG